MFRCGICKKKGFSSEQAIRSHINTHILKCKKCEQIFYRKTNLKWHTDHVHDGRVWTRLQFGGGVKPTFSSKNWDAFTTKKRQTNIGFSETSYNLIFKKYNKSVNDTLLSRMSFIKKVLYDVVIFFKNKMSDSDTLQLILFGNPNSVKSMFSTQFLPKNDLSYDFISKKVVQFLNSNEYFEINKDMSLDVKMIETNGGRALGINKAPNLLLLLHRKRCIINIENTDTLCFAKSLIISYYHYKLKKNLISHSFWVRKLKTKKSTFLTQRAIFLQQSVKLPLNFPVKINDIHRFQFFFKQNQINVFDIHNGKLNKIYSTNMSCLGGLNILYYNNHYSPILSLKAMKGVTYKCKWCDHFSTNALLHHVCKNKCFFCHSRKHDEETVSVKSCKICKQLFFSQICYNQHKKKIYGGKSVCDIFQKCKKCAKIHNIKKKCEKYFTQYCNYCQLKISSEHDCYINPDKKIENFRKYVIYDIESALEKSSTNDKSIHTAHVPNMVCSRLLCENCLSHNFTEHCELCEINFFTHKSCIVDFLNYLSPFKNITVISHGGSGYDNILLLSSLFRIYANRNLQILPSGNNVISVEIGNKDIIFRDSNLFFKSALSKLPSFFGFENTNLIKPYYPYIFNCEENYNYVGKLPSIEYYDTSKMCENEKSDFLNWHNKNQNELFDFWDELKKYCLADVNILSQACCIYRKNNLKYNIDPFNCYTIAQLTYKIFKNNFLQKNSIIRLPERKENTSLKAQNWLSYYEKKHNVNVIRANAPKEYKIKNTNYHVDGYIKSQHHVLEFLGCYYHAHPLHFSKNDIVFGGKKASEVYLNTMKRICRIKELGYRLTYIWECEFDALRSKNIEKFQYYPKTLYIRSALYGGRTEVFSVYNDFLKNGKKGRFVDVVSLYPSVMSTQIFPVGKPVLLNNEDIPKPFNINDYFGVIMCEVKPPEKLLIPVLPYKSKNGKLLFPLCKACCENKITNCTHFGKRSRNLIGAWCTPELKLAISEGYTIENIHQIYHFKNSSSTLFKKFIMEMLRDKLESSGYPLDVITKKQQKKYIKHIFQNNGITLNPNNIKHNPSVRHYSKNILTNLWGKFAQNSANNKEMVLINSAKKLMEINEKIKNKKIIVNNMYSLKQEGDNDMVLVDFHKTFQHTEVPQSSNPILASFVTSYARIALYKTLKIIGKNLVYTDTDSAFYWELSNEISSKLNIGNGLGQLKNELSPHNWIILQICLAAKTYGYITKLPENGLIEFLRNKGFSTRISKTVNVESFIELFRNKNTYISIENKNFFLRNRQEGKVFMKTLSKKFNYNYDKRIVINDSQTLPWGYNQNWWRDCEM